MEAITSLILMGVFFILIIVFYITEYPIGKE